MQLSKETVLERLDQAKIFERYLGFSVSLNTKYRNPLRPDDNAGCFFKETYDRLYFCDYAHREYSGDCFRIIQIINNCDFYAALQIINIDFDLGLEDKYIEQLQYKGQPANGNVFLPNQRISKHKKVRIQIEHMPFLAEDLAYWNLFGIKQSTLEKFNVYSCYRSWINQVLYYQYTLVDPQYAYIFPDDHVKVYRPKVTNKEFKFRTNCPPHVIQGYEQLPGYGEHLIITSSMKDAMTLYECGYSAIAPQSENTIIPENLIEQFEHRFANITIFYDNDEPGLKHAQLLSDCCGFNMISLPITSTTEGLVKDPSDFYKSYGKEALMEFLEKNIK